MSWLSPNTKFLILFSLSDPSNSLLRQNFMWSVTSSVTCPAVNWLLLGYMPTSGPITECLPTDELSLFFTLSSLLFYLCSRNLKALTSSYIPSLLSLYSRMASPRSTNQYASSSTIRSILTWNSLVFIYLIDWFVFPVALILSLRLRDINTGMKYTTC